jgi:hypothetical protein
MRDTHGLSAQSATTQERGTLVLGDPLVLRQRRFADRLLARVYAGSLDRQLAAGCPPETALLLAARADDIVSMRARRAVAANWDHLLRVTRRPEGRRWPAIPVRSARILAAEPAIRELMRALTTPLPVSARGVAMAIVLLTDATGPVYTRRGSGTLAAALEDAITQLDPALPLMRTA